MMLVVYEDVHFFHRTNTILKLGKYEVSNNFCLKIVIKELEMSSSPNVSVTNVPVKAEAFQISVGF